MKKTIIVISCLLAAMLVLIVGTGILAGAGTQIIRFNRQVEITDGVVETEAGQMMLMLENDSDYELHLSFEVSKPGLLNGIRIVNAYGKPVFACTGDNADIQSMPIYLKQGEYVLETHYLNSQKDFEDFCELAELKPEFIGDATFEYVTEGTWDIAYELKVMDTRSNAFVYVLVSGIIAGLLLVVVLLAITKTNDKLKCEFDERQDIVRGKGFKYGFFTMAICNGLFAVLNLCQVSLFAKMEVAMALSIIMGSIVCACYCILNDGYFALNENRKGLLICFAIIALVNLGMGIMSFVQGYGIENGSLTFGSINLFCGIMILVIMGAIWCKHIKDSWEEY